ncbi:MAG: Ig-like domain-containing protein, partial [Verrucomicrobiota bacterium]
KDLLDWQLDNAGTVNWTQGTIRTGSGAVINNSGLWHVQVDNGIHNDFGGALSGFNNSGTLRKSSTAGASTMSGIVLSNSGSIEIIEGTLNVNGGFNHTGNGRISGGVLSLQGGTGRVEGMLNIENNGKLSIDGAVITLAAGAQINGLAAGVSAGELRLEGALMVETLTVRGGVLTGPGVATVANAFAWMGGQLGGNNGGRGQLRLAATAISTISEAGFKDLLNWQLDNAGTVNWTQGTIRTGSGAVINNSGLWHVQVDNGIHNDFGGALSGFNNSGTLRKSATAGASTMSGIVLSNSGSIEIIEGTLNINGGFNHTGNGRISGGVLSLQGGTGRVEGMLNIENNGKFSIDGAVITLAAGAQINGVAAAVSAGELRLEGAMMVETLTVRGGVLTGPGVATVANAFVWMGGQLGGNNGGRGQLRLAATAISTISEAGFKDLLDWQLENAGTVNWTQGTIRTGSGAVINNSGLWHVQVDNGIHNDFGGALSGFNNSGTLRKSANAGASTMSGIVLSNSGGIEIIEGTLNVNGGFNHIGSGRISGGVLSLQGGTGSVEGMLNIENNGKLSIDGAVITLAAGAQINGVAAGVSAGELRLEGALMVETLTVRGGVLTGPGVATVANAFVWMGGQLGGNNGGRGQLRLAATAISTISEAGFKDLLDWQLDNAGTVNWTQGTIRTGSGAVINNSGLWHVQVDNGIHNDFGGALSMFNNSGIFRKTVATGSTSFSGVAFNNSGSLDIQTGSINFNGLFNEAPALTLDVSPAVGQIGEGFVLMATASDNDGVAQVTFFNGLENLGADALEPYTLSVDPLPVGTHTLSATAVDARGAARTATVRVRVNAPPETTLVASRTLLNPGEALRLEALASDSDGRVLKVEFFNGAVKLGEDLAAPFALELNNLSVGQHLFTAKSTDEDQAAKLSNAVTVTVNAPPAIALTITPSAITLTQTATLRAEVSDNDGTVVKVEFFNGATKLGEASAAPFTLPASELPVGEHTFTAIAIDNHGATQRSEPVTLRVNPLQDVAQLFVERSSYVAGELLIVTFEVAFETLLTGYAWELDLPSGWTHLADTSRAQERPSFGQAGPLVWNWTGNFPSSPARFQAVLQVPSGETGSKTLTARTRLREPLRTVETAPLVLHPAGSSQVVRLCDLQRSIHGAVRFTFGFDDGTAIEPGQEQQFEIQSSADLVHWVSTPGTATMKNGELTWIGTEVFNAPRQYFRVLKKP